MSSRPQFFLVGYRLKSDPRRAFMTAAGLDHVRRGGVVEVLDAVSSEASAELFWFGALGPSIVLDATGPAEGEVWDTAGVERAIASGMVFRVLMGPYHSAGEAAREREGWNRVDYDDD